MLVSFYHGINNSTLVAFAVKARLSSPVVRGEIFQGFERETSNITDHNIFVYHLTFILSFLLHVYYLHQET